jgi:hypothetical protein
MITEKAKKLGEKCRMNPFSKKLNDELFEEVAYNCNPTEHEFHSLLERRLLSAKALYYIIYQNNARK